MKTAREWVETHESDSVEEVIAKLEERERRLRIIITRAVLKNVEVANQKLIDAGEASGLFMVSKIMNTLWDQVTLSQLGDPLPFEKEFDTWTD